MLYLYYMLRSSSINFAILTPQHAGDVKEPFQPPHPREQGCSSPDSFLIKFISKSGRYDVIQGPYEQQKPFHQLLLLPHDVVHMSPTHHLCHHTHLPLIRTSPLHAMSSGFLLDHTMVPSYSKPHHGWPAPKGCHLPPRLLPPPPHRQHHRCAPSAFRGK